MYLRFFAQFYILDSISLNGIGPYVLDRSILYGVSKLARPVTVFECMEWLWTQILSQEHRNPRMMYRKNTIKGLEITNHRFFIAASAHDTWFVCRCKPHGFWVGVSFIKVIHPKLIHPFRSISKIVFLRLVEIVRVPLAGGRITLSGLVLLLALVDDKWEWEV